MDKFHHHPHCRHFPSLSLGFLLFDLRKGKSRLKWGKNCFSRKTEIGRFDSVLHPKKNPSCLKFQGQI